MTPDNRENERWHSSKDTTSARPIDLGRRNTVEALRGVDVVDRARRDGRDHGTVGLGQEHADAHPRPAPRARLRTTAAARPGLRRPGHGRRRRGRATRIRAREMGFVFQDFNLVPTLTALENVMLACDYAGMNGAVARPPALEALAPRRAGRSCRPPAGRAVRRRAAAGRDRPCAREQADLVLADEPTGNLDSETSRRDPGAPAAFNREKGLTVVLVTHETDVGAACDRIIRMRDGKIREEIRTVEQPRSPVRSTHSRPSGNSSCPLKSRSRLSKEPASKLSR